MTIQYHIALRNSILSRVEVHIGESPWLDLRTGAKPASPSDADTGIELVHMQLPANWLNFPSNAQATKANVWSGTAIDNGTVNHFRIKDSSDVTTYMQGNVTAIDGGGDMEIDNVAITTDMEIEINSFTLSIGNA